MDVSVSPLARLTVVVPVGPGDCMSPQLRSQLAQLPAAAQVCVVDCETSTRSGASADSAASHSRSSEVDGPRWRWLRSLAGRSVQQNAGAAAADGDWLWFLHADAALAESTLPALARLIAADVPALGFFDLRFLGDGPALMRLNTVGAWLRSRWLGLPFGDQGLVLPRSLFHAIGGFDPTTARGEDHQLVWRVRRAGLPVMAVGAPIYTSARRYAASGWTATTREHLGETWRQAWRFSRTERSP